jgi:hypothetical protein
VTSSYGATDTAEDTVSAVELAVKSEPSGVVLTAADIAKPAPFSLFALRGSNVQLSAPEVATLDGANYMWSAWSDAGARVHPVVASEQAAYSAIYRLPQGGEASIRDIFPPQTRLRKRPGKVTGRRASRFAFRASERGSRFRCKRDGKRFRPCRSPKIYKRLGRGKHVFKVFAIDAAGNADRTPAVFRWRIVRSQ